MRDPHPEKSSGKYTEGLACYFFARKAGTFSTVPLAVQKEFNELSSKDAKKFDAQMCLFLGPASLVVNGES